MAETRNAQRAENLKPKQRPQPKQSTITGVLCLEVYI